MRQADAQWRKVQVKLEGEDEYEALDKFDRLEVFQDHIRWAQNLSLAVRYLNFPTCSTKEPFCFPKLCSCESRPCPAMHLRSPRHGMILGHG